MSLLQTPRSPINDYILGHSEDELDRLIYQASFFGDLTEQVLRLAGIEPGMRVLDIGCGTGDVSFLAAKLVGPSGSVIGVDRAPDAIAVARRRAVNASETNVHFVTADLSEFTPDTRADALIGRFILMYFPDPAALLRQWLACIEPGGIVAFQEMDMTSTTSEPHCELTITTGERIVRTFVRAGIDPRTGLKLRSIFQEAGLTAPRMIQGARVEGGPNSPAYEYMEQVTRTLLPLMEQTGVATADEVRLETLAVRLRDEVVANEAVIVLPPLIGAWARKSAD